MSQFNLASYAISIITRYFSKSIRKVYYSTRESIGEHKREIVVQQVGSACKSLQETKEEFESWKDRHMSSVCCIHGST